MASYLINSSYVDWSNSPVSTSISTVPIEDLPFPKVTVCPVKGANTALNYDLMKIKYNQLGEIYRVELLTILKDLFLNSPHTAFANTSKELVGRHNLKQCYKGLQTINFPSNGKYATTSIALEGNLTTAWKRQRFDQLKKHDYGYYRRYEYTIQFPADLFQHLSNGLITINIRMDGEAEVLFEGLGTPADIGNRTNPWDTKTNQRITHHDILLDWNDAASKCREEGGYLAYARSQAELDDLLFLSPYLPFWLGATHKEDGKTWQWEDGSHWNFTKWSPSYPTNNGNCLYVNPYSKFMIEGNCNTLNRFFCKNMFTSYHLKPPGTTIAYKMDQLQSNKFVAKWNYTASESQTCDTMAGLSITWRLNVLNSVFDQN